MVNLKQIDNKIIRLEEIDNITFKVYDITGYDFKENITLPDETSNLGVYIFTKRINEEIGVGLKDGKNEWVYATVHELLYCGKTSEINQRFHRHHKAKDLKGVANSLCIHICETESEIDDIERLLLSTHNFRFNKILNNWLTKEEEVVEEP